MDDVEDIIDKMAGPEEPEKEDDQVDEIVEEHEEEPDPEPEDKPEEKPEERTVPLATLLSEREEAKRTEIELRERVSKVEALWQSMQQQAQKTPEPELPTYDDDPEAHVLARLQQVEARNLELEKAREESTARTAESEQEQKLLDHYAASVRIFTAQTLDFQAAYEHLAKSVDADLMARGITDPNERANAIQYEEGLLVGRALHGGKDPATLIYEYAKHRGYAPGNGEDKTKIQKLAEGQKASRSLSGTRGSAEVPTSVESLVELADTDPEEFDKQWEKMRRKGLLG